MNQGTQLRYTHIDHTRQIPDVRRKPVPDVALEQLYYLGFRYMIGNAYFYHHALIMADDYESLLDGINREQGAILDMPEDFTRDVTLVFMRNLLTQSPNIMSAADKNFITAEINEGLSRRDDHQFMVLGLVGDKSFSLVREQAKNALLAIKQTRTLGTRNFGEAFLPIEVCQAHPVTHEFNRMFDAAAKRIKPLIGNVTAKNRQLH